MVRKTSHQQPDVTLGDLYQLCQALEVWLIALEKRVATNRLPRLSIPEQLHRIQYQLDHLAQEIKNRR
jgi:hypothetical protein